MVVAVLVVLQVIIWKETNGNWNKLYEFCEHKSSGSFPYCTCTYIGMATLPCGHITTVDREIFTLNNLHKKIFMLINFRGSFDPRNFFNN